MFKEVVLSTENEGGSKDLPPDPREPDKSITKASQGPIVAEATILTVGWMGSTGASIVREVRDTFDQALQGRPPFCNTRHLARITPAFKVTTWPTFTSLPDTWNKVMVLSSTHKHLRSAVDDDDDDDDDVVVKVNNEEHLKLFKKPERSVGESKLRETLEPSLDITAFEKMGVAGGSSTDNTVIVVVEYWIEYLEADPPDSLKSRV
jgi:hypothetical protein